MSRQFLMGLAIVLGLGLSSSAQADLSAFTGTFQIAIEGASSGSVPFGRTADVSVATGSIALPGLVLTSDATFSTSGSSHPLFYTFVASAVAQTVSGTLTPSGGPGGAFGGNIPVSSRLVSCGDFRSRNDPSLVRPISGLPV